MEYYFSEISDGVMMIIIAHHTKRFGLLDSGIESSIH